MNNPPLTHSVKSPSPEGTKVFQLLQEYLQPSITTPPAAVADEINNIATALQTEKSDIEQFLWETWKTFIGLAKQVPHDHPSVDRLVAVVGALTELAPTTIQIWGDDMRLWSDLPLLSPSIREAWTSPTATTATPTEQAVQEWTNLNSFVARLSTLPSISWVDFPIWVLRSALEEDITGQTLACEVSAAAEWVKHAGPTMAHQLATRTGGEEENRVLRGGTLYNGPASMCSERWEFWKARFGQIAALDGETGRKARMAKEAMEQSERTR